MKEFFDDLKNEFIKAMREAPRAYFAVFVGAYRGIRTEFASIREQSSSAK